MFNNCMSTKKALEFQQNKINLILTENNLLDNLNKNR